MMRFFTKRLTSLWHRDERGHSMTEFAITLPLWIILMVGIAETSKITKNLCVNEGTAYRDTMNAWLQVQMPGQGKFGDMVDQITHTLPSLAAIDGATKVWDYPARQKSDALKTLIGGEEGLTLAAMGFVGHWGPAAVRLKALQLFGVKFAYGINPTVQNMSLMSPQNAIIGGSDFAYDVVYDGPTISTLNGGFSGQGVVGTVLGMLNGVVSATGGRSALAANMRYGRVLEEKKTTHSNMYTSFEQSSWYVANVPPRISRDANSVLWSDGGDQKEEQMYAMGVERFAMVSRNHYRVLSTYMPNGNTGDGAALRVWAAQSGGITALNSPQNIFEAEVLGYESDDICGKWHQTDCLIGELD
jgi:hypothetical protein